MVSLYDLVTSQQQFSHLTTYIPTLDASLFTHGRGTRHRVFDFQAGPGNASLYTVTASLIVSHLAASPSNSVLVVDTLDPFPWHLITSHPDFEPSWLDTSLVSYTTDTFAKLYSLLISDAFLQEKDAITSGKTILVINGYHELLEMYKLELSEVYEETILKLHLEANAVVISNQEQFREAGTRSTVPQIPPQSDLLRESPVKKFEGHVLALVSAISDYAFKNGSICILVGHMDTSYQLDKPKSQSLLQSQSENSSFSSQSESTSFAAKGRLVLTTAFGGKNPTFDQKNTFHASLDAFITTRVILYKDWYFKSTHFHENFPPYDPNDPVINVNQAQFRLVFAARVQNVQQTASQEISPPIYFDHDNEYYHLDDEDYENPTPPKYKFIDLSRSVIPVGGIRSQSFANPPPRKKQKANGSTNSTGSGLSSDPGFSSPVIPMEPMSMPTESQLMGLVQSTQNEQRLNSEPDITEEASRQPTIVDSGEEPRTPSDFESDNDEEEIPPAVEERSDNHNRNDDSEVEESDDGILGSLL